MREITVVHSTLSDLLAAGNDYVAAPDSLPVQSQIDKLNELTLPDRPYSKAARATPPLTQWSYFCAQPEEMPLFASTAEG